LWNRHRASLSNTEKYAYLAENPHHVAIEKAFEFGVSSSEGGLGLTTVMDNVEELGGTLRLASGDGFVTKFVKRPARFRKTIFDLAGVQIDVVIPTGWDSDEVHLD
jgi:hypothetical protein